MYWIDQDGAERHVDAGEDLEEQMNSWMQVEDVLTVLTPQQITGIKRYTFNQDGEEYEVNDDDEDTFVFLKTSDVLPLLKKRTNESKKKGKKPIVEATAATGPMQLYVWTGWGADYTDGLAVALAHSKEEAMTVIEAQSATPDRGPRWGELTVYPINKPFGVSVFGGG